MLNALRFGMLLRGTRQFKDSESRKAIEIIKKDYRLQQVPDTVTMRFKTNEHGVVSYEINGPHGKFKNTCINLIAMGMGYANDYLHDIQDEAELAAFGKTSIS